MKRYYQSFGFITVLVLASVFGCNGIASAHVLKENNGVSAVLHIPPDDNPVAAKSTSLDFSFNSDSGNFSLEDCDCNVTVQSNGKTLEAVPLKRPFDGGALDASASVRFPAIGIYDVIVTGSSKTARFKPFTLDYLERVATSTDTPNVSKANNGALVILFGSASLVLLAMIAYAAIDYGGRYKKTRKP